MSDTYQEGCKGGKATYIFRLRVLCVRSQGNGAFVKQKSLLVRVMNTTKEESVFFREENKGSSSGGAVVNTQKSRRRE